MPGPLFLLGYPVATCSAEAISAIQDRAMVDPADASDAEHVYANHFRRCEMFGVEPEARERALGLIRE